MPLKNSLAKCVLTVSAGHFRRHCQEEHRTEFHTWDLEDSAGSQREERQQSNGGIKFNYVQKEEQW